MKLVSGTVCELFLSSDLLYSQVNVDGAVRLRFESFNNMNDKYYGTNPKTGKSSDSCLLTRLRLGLTYKFDENFKAKISLQDARALGWGFNNDNWYNKEFKQENNPQRDYFELNQTYLQYQNKNSTVTIGRQKIAYGDNRVFGPGEWKNAGKWIWDAVKVSYKNEDNYLDFFYGATMLHDPDKFSLEHRHGYYGGGMYGHYAYRKTAAAEPIFAYKQNKRSNEAYISMKSYYAGFRLYDANLYGYFYDMTYLKSFGDFTKLNNTTVDIDGVGVHIEGGFHLKSLNTKVCLGYTYASGDNPATSDRETFDGAFGASDKYYGRLNLMSWSNLKDYELFTMIKPMPKVKVKIEYHKFYADEPTGKWKSYTIASMQNDHYGDEVDIVTKYNYSKNINLMLGLSYFDSGDYIKEASTKNSFIINDNAYGVFTQFQYKFTTRK
ncbi:MAG: alginate export family protein [Sulfurimonas sp.]|nr:alginate export family protein [Sulfurimonas sp.]